MLHSFKVTNHRSFRDEQELVLVPAYDKSRPCLPVVGLFGPNASGKSHLLDALGFVERAVRSSYRLWEPGSGVPRTPYRLDPEAFARPSTYQVDVVLDHVRHVYGISVDDERVVEEWLYRWPNGRKQRVFERDTESIRLGSTVRRYRSRQARLQDETRENASLLATATQLNVAETRAMYGWFETALHWFGPKPREFLESLDLGVVSRWLFDDPKSKAVLVSLLRAADLGIDDVELVNVPVPISEPLLSRWRERMREELPAARDLLEGDVYDQKPARMRRELIFRHGDVPFTAWDESAGALAWLSILIRALTALREGALLVVDEIDSGLHPYLTTQVIRMFQDREINPSNAQLIFTTHDATLLGTFEADDILRRDEVWFTQKDRKSGAAELFALTDFRSRNDSAMKRYMGGAYGAIPGVSVADTRRAFGLEPWRTAGDAAS